MVLRTTITVIRFNKCSFTAVLAQLSFILSLVVVVVVVMIIFLIIIAI